MAVASGLTPKGREELLRIARKTLESYLKDRSFPEMIPSEPCLQEKAGAFVTLYSSPSEELRGCIGHMTADRPLFLAVQEMAVQAATVDPRFPGVQIGELPKIRIEISVLSPLRTIAEPSEVKVGEHGVIVRRGFHRGVLLPQVPVREGWNREQFLNATCLKAGLPAGSWQEGDVEIQIFTAEQFGEKKDLG